MKYAICSMVQSGQSTQEWKFIATHLFTDKLRYKMKSLSMGLTISFQFFDEMAKRGNFSIYTFC